MSEAPVPNRDDGNSDQSDGPPSAGRAPPDETPASCSDSSSSSDDDAGEPLAKRKRQQSEVTVDPRIDALYDQVSLLTNIIMHQQYNSNNQVVEQPNSSNADFLTNPSASTAKKLELGPCKTDFDDKKFIKPADHKRLQQLIELQHFNTANWQHVRYNKALQDMIAQPGFCNLKINEELCCLNKGKDFLAPTELITAALTNAGLQQRELLQSGLQNIIDWAHKNPSELNPDSLFDRISETFGKSSPSYKLTEQSLQIMCGKRAECIESRRRRLLAEISDRNVQAALSSIPPSEEYLFDKSKLTALIHSLGGPHFWLSQSQNYQKDKPNLKRKAPEPTPSTSKYYSQHRQSSQNNNKKPTTKQNYPNKNNNSANKQQSFRNKKK